MEEFQSGLWKLVPPAARIVQIDVDPFEIGRNVRPDVAVVGDAKLVLAQLAGGVTPTTSRPSTDEYVRFKEGFEERGSLEGAPGQGAIKTKQVGHRLNEVFGDLVLVN